MPSPARESRASIPLRHVLAVFIGNALEFYDFLTYGYFAVYIGRAFFPSQSATASLLASLATFGVGFLTRPVGAIVIGSIGDRRGRKPAMLLSFALMGVGILGLALTPGYATIGVAAPVLAIFFRLVQGFALGGNIGPSTAYMIEAAPLERRGIYSSMQYVTQDLAGLVAAIIGLVLATVLTPPQLQDWGWRVAMLIGAAIVPFGLMLRQTLPETLPNADVDAPVRAEPQPAARAERLRPHLRIIILGLLILTSTTIGAYVVAYMTTYAIATLHMADRFAFGVSIVSALCSVTFEASSGWLSDRFGRKPVMLVPGFVLLVSIIPGFLLIAHFRNVAALYGAMAWLVPLAALSYTPAITLITESLPMAIRSGVGATIYALAISIFGGSTQFVITWLIDVLHNPIAPAYYWTAASVLGLTAMALTHESAPVKAQRPAETAFEVV